MELAIPLIALGGMYVASNQRSNECKKKPGQKTIKNGNPGKNKTNGSEGFTNLHQNQNYLPNVNIPPENYPIMNDKELVDTVQEFVNPNVATDKYFDQNFFESQSNAGVKVGNTPQHMYSLSGNYLDSKEFKHNNMVPFYGAKIRGQIYNNNNAQSVLDNMIGTGSQTIKKIEQAPLFKPQDNVQWAYGAPNMSDFFQSRVNPGMANNNVKPFESEYVGPGLDRGYTANGSDGYNAGMEARDKWLPKTVDELRIATNPKQEFSLLNHEGPGESLVKNVGILGKVEKYTPDTFFLNTQDRWLTTTGLEKGNRLVAEEIVKTSHRNDVTQHYQGVASSAQKTAGYIPGKTQDPKRPVLEVNDVAHSSAVGRGSTTMHGEKSLKSHTNYVNNRSCNDQPATMRSGFSAAIGAVIAPLMDVLKPSKKEEYVSNIRVYGNTASSVPANYTLNPYDTPNTTIKETTLYQPNAYIGNQKEGAYMVSEQQAIENQRDTTTCTDYVGTVGGGATRHGYTSYDSAYIATTNQTKEKLSVSRTNHGNTQIFNQNTNISIAKVDADRNNNRMWAPAATTPIGPNKETYGKINVPQYYNQCIGCERIEPNILDAFRANPYTHSLTNSV